MIIKPKNYAMEFIQIYIPTIYLNVIRQTTYLKSYISNTSVNAMF